MFRPRCVRVGLIIPAVGTVLLLALLALKLSYKMQTPLPLELLYESRNRVTENFFAHTEASSTEEHTSNTEYNGFAANKTKYQDGKLANRPGPTTSADTQSTAQRKEQSPSSNLQQGGYGAKPSHGNRTGLGKSVLSSATKQPLVSSPGVGNVHQNTSEIVQHNSLLQQTEQNRTICTKTVTLPQPVINNIKSFLYFIGHGSSGHSIVGSILDSHPHIVVSHEFNAIDKVDSLNDKTRLFNGIWSSSCKSLTRNGWRNDKSDDKGFTLAIHNLYQGAYQSHIDIIGDKRGDMTVKMYMKNPHKFESTFSKLKSIVKMPMKVFHVIRNPYDNIGTSSLYDKVLNNVTMIATIKNSDHVQSLDPRIVDSHITTYFKLYQAIEEMKVKYKLDVLEVHGKDLIADPKKVLMKMCDFLQVSCPDDFLNLCADKIYPKESKTRYKLKWTEYQISAVKTNITKYQNLHRYLDFDS